MHDGGAGRPASCIGAAIARLAVPVALALSALVAPAGAVAATGDLDTSFSTDGIQTHPVGTSTDLAYAVARQDDGKLVAVGSTFNGADTDFAVVRLDADGSPDATFDTDGRVTTDYGPNSSYEHAYAVAIQPDGRIVVVGSRSRAGTDFMVVRYNTDGSLDTTFNLTGKVITDVGGLGFTDIARSVAIQSNGRIVVAGEADSSGAGTGNPRIGLVRYKSDGTLDTTFSDDGRQMTQVGADYDDVRGVAIQTDQKIVVGGSSDDDFMVARFDSSGTLDPTFSVDGSSTFAFDSTYDFARAVAVQDDQQVVIAGYSAIAGNGGAWGFAVARLNGDGSLDDTFDTDGRQVTTMPGQSIWANALTVQGDGKVVLAGATVDNATNNTDYVIARYGAGGAPDTAFAGDGLVQVDVTGAEGFGNDGDEPFAVLVQPDERIVVAGASFNGTDQDITMVRLIGLPPPANSVLPAITGTTAVGSTLTCSDGTWSNSPTDYTYQWKTAAGADLAGATDATHVVTFDDTGVGVTCEVTATNEGGSTAATSAALAIARLAGTVTLRQATSTWGTRSCGATLATACAATGRVYVKGTCSPSAALAGRTVTITFQRRRSNGTWQTVFTKTATASACSYRTSTSGVTTGRWRARSTMAATTHATAAASAYQYVTHT